MDKKDFKQKLAEEVQSGLRGFIESALGQADHQPDGSIKIDKWTVKRWKKVMKLTHYKLEPHQKRWANAVVEKIVCLMEKIKKNGNKTPPDPRVKVLKDKFVEYCDNIKGFKPILNHGRDTIILKERLKDYDEDKILDCFDWFLGNKEYEKFSPGISTCLSANIFNKFLQERG